MKDSINSEYIEVLLDLEEFQSSYQNYDLALIILQDALSRTHNTFNQKDKEGRIYSKLGIVYFNMKDYPNAIDNYNKALSYFRDLNDDTNVARILNNLGFAYYRLTQFKDALTYYNMSLFICQNNEDLKTLSTVNNNLKTLESLQFNSTSIIWLLLREINSMAGILFFRKSFSLSESCQELLN